MTAAIDRQAQVLLVKAAEDEAVVRLPGVPDDPFGFHVQQAIEKLLKALLSQLSVEYRFTHDLGYLVDQLTGAGEILPSPVVEFSKLEDFAVTIRYDEIPEIHILDRPCAIETVGVLRENVIARIAALAAAP
jgi:hypothetical protein